MPEEVVLYDVCKPGYPTEKNAEFRTLQVFQCEWCGAKTNRALFNEHVIVFCPYYAECWHHEVMGKKMLLAQPHPASYIKELQQEIQKLLERYQPQDNLVGEPSRNGRRSRNTSAVRGFKKGCRHRSIIWPGIG